MKNPENIYFLILDTREYYQTGENVVDGTKCSYDKANDICIQGKCVELGCDKVRLNLKAERPRFEC